MVARMVCREVRSTIRHMVGMVIPKGGSAQFSNVDDQSSVGWRLAVTEYAEKYGINKEGMRRIWNNMLEIYCWRGDERKGQQSVRRGIRLRFH